MKKEFKFLKERADEFSEYGERAFEESKYAFSAFNLEQAARLYLKYTLALLVGDYPKTHELSRLLDLIFKASDIDVLVVGPEVKGKERGRVRARLKKAVDFFSPFEIHLVTEDQFENWYKRFIKQDLAKIP